MIGAIGAPSAARSASKVVLDRFRAVTCSVAVTYAARCIDAYHAFNGPAGTLSAGTFLAADHDHASQAGHTVIASLLSRAGYAPLIA